MRFAPLIRVSTEAQGKRGESLHTQRKQLESAIDSLGGKVYHWYAGQEHATPEQERKILDELMRDAKEKKFDAVIVCDTSRWSRDNRRSKEDLEILKNHNIRFYVGMTEYNLYDPTSSFILNMGVEIAEYHAKEQSYKSIINRIAKAEKGYPCCGKIPYGRICPKNTNQWSVDQAKMKIIEEVARIYLKEDIGFNELGKRFGMNGSNLRKILIERSGELWEQHFKSKSLKIDKVVITKVPRLLPDDTINRIKEKSQARKTYARGSYKYDYLLSSMIFDSESRHALTGTPNSKGKRYYKPYLGSMAHRYMVNADIIESAVLEGLNEILMRSDLFSKAVFDGCPVGLVEDELKKKKRTLAKEIASQRRKISNLISAIKYLNGDEVENFIKQARSDIVRREKNLNDLQFQYDSVVNQIDTLPTQREIEDKMEQFRVELLRRTQESYLRSGLALESLPFSEKKKIISLLFGGRNEMGKRYGIYVTPLEGMPRRYRFKAYGRLGSIDGLVNARNKEYSSYSRNTNNSSNELLDKTAGIISDTYPDLKIKEDMLGQCHAHHGVRIHK